MYVIHLLLNADVDCIKYLQIHSIHIGIFWSKGMYPAAVADFTYLADSRLPMD